MDIAALREDLEVLAPRVPPLEVGLESGRKDLEAFKAEKAEEAATMQGKLATLREQLPKQRQEAKARHAARLPLKSLRPLRSLLRLRSA